jgi:hypothetical protein
MERLNGTKKTSPTVQVTLTEASRVLNLPLSRLQNWVHKRNLVGVGYRYLGSPPRCHRTYLLVSIEKLARRFEKRRAA